MVSHGLWTISTPVPVDRTIAAAAICVASFASGGSVRMSSMRPGEEQEDVAPAKMPTSCVVDRERPDGHGEPHARRESRR